MSSYWGLRKYSGNQDLIWGGDEKCVHEWNMESIKKQNTPVAMAGRFGDGNGQGRIEKPTENITINYEHGFCSLCGAWKGAYGLEPTPELYCQHSIEILREIKRVLRKDGVVFWNIGDSYAMTSFRGGDKAISKGNVGHKEWTNFENRSTAVSGLKPKDLCLIPFRVAIAAQEDGWWVRSVIIWSKPNPMPESCTDRPTESHEYILLLTKSGTTQYWTHRDKAGTRTQPEPDYRWIHKEIKEEVTIKPEGWTPKNKMDWDRINLWRGHDYYWDSFAVRENPDTAGAANLTSFGSSALAPELGPALDTDYGAMNCRGQLNLRQSENTIIGTVALETQYFEIIKSIGISIISENSKRDFVIDLQPLRGTASLALITSTLQSLSANHTPVRATVIDATTFESRIGFTDSMGTIPASNTFLGTEPMIEPSALLARVAEENLTAVIALDFDGASKPLLISGILRSSHMPHYTINTNKKQGRNLRSVWTFPTQPYKGAHFATFPEKLVEICVKAATPEVGCCSKCGAPQMRIVNKPKPPESVYTDSHLPDDGFVQKRSMGQKMQNWLDKHPSKTLGWQPTCKCNVDKVPSIVLDPFLGSGTVCWVAKKLGRRAVGYELSEEYCKLAVERNKQGIIW